MTLRSTLAASAILASSMAWAQRDSQSLKSNSPARFSYTNTWPVDNKDGESSQICFAVQPDGYYQMQRLTSKGTELVAGTVPATEFKKLERLLEDPEFRTLPSSVGGVILKGGESFVADFSEEAGEHRLFLENPDGERPFPRSASAIIGWLQHFRPQGGERLDVSHRDICPGAVMKLVRPEIAFVAPAVR